MTRWVINEALRQQREWSDAGLDLTVAINISGRSLNAASELPDALAELTAAWFPFRGAKAETIRACQGIAIPGSGQL